jgi:hypothetical protein
MATSEPPLPETWARAILQTAIVQGRAAELLGVLFEGGGVTLTSERELVLISAEEIRRLAGTAAVIDDPDGG